MRVPAPAVRGGACSPFASHGTTVRLKLVFILLLDPTARLCRRLATGRECLAMRRDSRELLRPSIRRRTACPSATPDVQHEGTRQRGTPAGRDGEEGFPEVRNGIEGDSHPKHGVFSRKAGGRVLGDSRCTSHSGPIDLQREDASSAIDAKDNDLAASASSTARRRRHDGSAFSSSRTPTSIRSCCVCVGLAASVAAAGRWLPPAEK
ncbi:hypothetical protein AB1Y20_003494 [Prymnesium parvum]|uniref:Uncharacterized protein n=1 Tax=Prymnesium parvum TaxID=97485 RepID=A0AB34JEB7_PRYPA